MTITSPLTNVVSEQLPPNPFAFEEWIANRRMKSIGIKPLYDIPAKNNPLPWTEHWISSKGLQVAPQETEVESYVVGGIKQDVKKDTFAGFKL
jgi:ribonucleotide reductase beta subunit family protein with ferritin-like domain